MDGASIIVFETVAAGRDLARPGTRHALASSSYLDRGRPMIAGPLYNNLFSFPIKRFDASGVHCCHVLILSRLSATPSIAVLDMR